MIFSSVFAKGGDGNGSFTFANESDGNGITLTGKVNGDEGSIISSICGRDGCGDKILMGCSHPLAMNILVVTAVVWRIPNKSFCAHPYV